MLNNEILKMALVGYRESLAAIDEKIADIQQQLGGRASTAPAPAAGDVPPAKPKRTMSDAARKRIAAAQKKRWAAFHKQEAAAE